jgi:hypothetical protein
MIEKRNSEEAPVVARESQSQNNQMCRVVTRTQTLRRAVYDGKCGSLGGRIAGLRLDLFFRLSLKGVLGALAGLGKVAVCAVLHRVGVTMTKLIFHGVVATLVAVVRLLGALSAVGIILEVVANTLCHTQPFDVPA